jgi:hypothetical protein
MSTLFRAITLASTVVCLPLAAQAAFTPFTLDFEALGQQQSGGSRTPVTTQFSAQGVTFGTGASAFGKFTGQNPAAGAGNSDGFIRNTVQSFMITVNPGANFDLLSFNFASPAGFFVDVVGRAACPTCTAGDTGQLFINPGTAWEWHSENLNLSTAFPTLGSIDNITFTAAGTSTLFALDNIAFGQTSPTGNVPEPAGFGLVALALAAAGLASKRRTPV